LRWWPLFLLLLYLLLLPIVPPICAVAHSRTMRAAWPRYCSALLFHRHFRYSLPQLGQRIREAPSVSAQKKGFYLNCIWFCRIMHILSHCHISDLRSEINFILDVKLYTKGYLLADPSLIPEIPLGKSNF
jgi:hypothetical protein